MVKSYNLPCPVAGTLDVVGERWTLLIMRDFVLHKTRRFQDLQESFTAIAPNILSARLKQLEQQKIIKRRQYSESPPRFEYILTKKGEELGTVIKALYIWGTKYA